MTQESTVAIWDPISGIKDFEQPPAELSSSSIPGIKAIWTEQRRRLQGSHQLSTFTEKLSREWAIETGLIENLYDIERGVTQTLIEHGFQAQLLTHGSTNKPREYVIRLLNDQKDALEGIFDFVKSERILSTSYIKELHSALLRSQQTTEAVDPQGRFTEVPLISGEWKSLANYPNRDGITYMYCPPEQVASEMDRLVEMHADHQKQEVQSEVKAAWFHHRFTQIHPFQDGNGRVARAIASLILIKDGLFPLIVTREIKHDYIDALEAADNGDLTKLVNLFSKLQASQFNKASNISEAVLIEENVDAALDGLIKAAERVATEQRKELQNVFGLAKFVEGQIAERLKDISPKIRQALNCVADKPYVSVKYSDDATNHYFRAQIFKNAKEHLGYFANTSEYRSWVALQMSWGALQTSEGALQMSWAHRAKIVFTIHGIGRPFNGSLVCAPFLEFKGTDEDGATANFVPLADEGLVLFYNESKEDLSKRLLPWWERVIKIALRELSNNL